jgi:hypothetical protein
MSSKKSARPPSSARPSPAALRSAESIMLSRYLLMRQAGITFEGKRDLYRVLGYSRIITNKMYRDEYARGGISKRIVEAYPKATWRGGLELQEDEDPKVSTPFETTWESLEKRLKVWSTLQRVDILAGLSQYAVLLIGAPGELNQELPRGNPDQLLYLTPFSGGGGPFPSSYTGTSGFSGAEYADATIRDLDMDQNSKRFGLPLTYQLRRVDATSPSLQVPVHWSRVLHVAEGTLDNDIYGQPVLENVFNLLEDLQKVTGGGAEAFWLRANQGTLLNVDKDAVLDEDAVKKLKEEVEDYKNNISRFLKTRGVDVKTLGSDVANFNQPADAILTQIAGSKGIPKRILMGSEMGQLASGQDADNWADQVQDRRTSYAGPCIVRPFVDRLIAYGYLPTPAKDYEVKWPVVEQLTETEKAEGAVQWASVNKTQGVTVFTPAEIRQKWYRLDPLTPEQEQPVQAPEVVRSVAPPPAKDVAVGGEPVAAPPSNGNGKVPPQFVKGAFPKAAEEVDLLVILEQALIENKTQVLNDILGPDYEGMLEALGNKEATE